MKYKWGGKRVTKLIYKRRRSRANKALTESYAKWKRLGETLSAEFHRQVFAAARLRMFLPPELLTKKDLEAHGYI